MEKLPQVNTKEELCALIEDIGFLPLFRSDIPGFSVEDITRGERWFSDDTEHDPWDWRKRIAAEGVITYGKLFRNKAGYISKKWYPKFANLRRDGYDFDSLYEEGLAPRRQRLVMKLFEGGGTLPSYEIKRRAGFGRNGEKGFEGALTTLQMQTYLTVCGFAQKRSKAGEEYGWATGLYTTPEALFGEAYVRSEYSQSPGISRSEIIDRCRGLFGNAPEDSVTKFISR
jgi:hypothetical protein